MTSISYNGIDYQLLENETILEGLTRHRVQINHSCCAGLCQTCVMTADQGEIPFESQKGLTNSQKTLNYFLSCQCIPTTFMAIRKPDNNTFKIPAVIMEKKWLNKTTLCLRVKTENIEFNAGQYFTLWKDENIARSYSISSHPIEPWLEFHIKIYDRGAFSQWLATQAQINDDIFIQGPMGLCFYQNNISKPILLSAIGTGLAPIFGILKDALYSAHEADIDLVIGANTDEGFYLVNELQLLEQQFSQLNVHFVCKEESLIFGRGTDIYQYVANEISELKNRQIYLCGAESFVTKMRKRCFLNGAAMNSIFSDSYSYASN